MVTVSYIIRSNSYKVFDRHSHRSRSSRTFARPSRSRYCVCLQPPSLVTVHIYGTPITLPPDGHKQQKQKKNSLQCCYSCCPDVFWQWHTGSSSNFLLVYFLLVLKIDCDSEHYDPSPGNFVPVQKKHNISPYVRSHFTLQLLVTSYLLLQLLHGYQYLVRESTVTSLVPVLWFSFVVWNPYVAQTYKNRQRSREVLSLFCHCCQNKHTPPEPSFSLTHLDQPTRRVLADTRPTLYPTKPNPPSILI